MHIILIGPPGSGKGTQAEWLSRHYKLVRLATGDMLREELASTSLSQPIKTTLEQGQLVSDTLVMTLIRERIAKTDCKKGFILDGFPRTLTQAKMLREEAIHIDYVFELVVPDATLIKRLSGRRIHPDSGRVYHIDYNPPKIKDRDDITGDLLVKRSDDHLSSIQKRLEIYHTQTKPVIQYYQQPSNSDDSFASKYYSLQGDDAIEAIRSKIKQILEK